MKEDGSSRRVRCYPSCVLVLCWLFYHSSGNDHEEIDLLKSAHKEGAITSAVFFFNNLAGIPSGPVALAVSRDFTNCQIS